MNFTDDDIKKLVGENVKKQRVAKGYTQRDFAVESNIDYSVINKIENGDRNLTLRTLTMLCNALECHPRDLFEPLGKS